MILNTPQQKNISQNRNILIQQQRPIFFLMKKMGFIILAIIRLHQIISIFFEKQVDSSKNIEN